MGDAILIPLIKQNLLLFIRARLMEKIIILFSSSSHVLLGLAEQGRCFPHPARSEAWAWQNKAKATEVIDVLHNKVYYHLLLHH